MANPLLKIAIGAWFILASLGCAQVQTEIEEIREGFQTGVEETKKAMGQSSKPGKPQAESKAPAPEGKKKAEIPKAKEPPSPGAEPALTKDIPPAAPPSIPKAEPEPPKKDFIYHRVVGGETLATIAKWYSGNAANWRKLVKHNPELRPFKLKGGETVKIPFSLATSHTEQPSHSTSVDPSKAVKKGAGSTGTPSPAQGTVFGPK